MKNKIGVSAEGRPCKWEIWGGTRTGGCNCGSVNRSWNNLKSARVCDKFDGDKVWAI